MVSPRAGQPAAAEDLVNVAKLVTAYYELRPDPGLTAQRVSFGTSGHRGSSLTGTFNEGHRTASGWFAARPSGTEDVYKLYAESFLGPDHLAEMQQQAREILAGVLN